MGNKPILTFDTSAINRLADDPACKSLIDGLASGFFVRLTFTSIDEVAQNSCGARREHLFGVCKQLLTSGDCLLPVGELLRKLVLAFENGSSAFALAQIDVRLGEAKERTLRGANVADVLSDAVRREAEPYKKKFEQINAEAKPAFDKVFEANPSARSASSTCNAISRTPSPCRVRCSLAGWVGSMGVVSSTTAFPCRKA